MLVKVHVQKKNILYFSFQFKQLKMCKSFKIG